LFRWNTVELRKKVPFFQLPDHLEEIIPKAKQ
jgi:hypothetical protein